MTISIEKKDFTYLKFLWSLAICCTLSYMSWIVLPYCAILITHSLMAQCRNSVLFGEIPALFAMYIVVGGWFFLGGSWTYFKIRRSLPKKIQMTKYYVKITDAQNNEETYFLKNCSWSDNWWLAHLNFDFLGIRKPGIILFPRCSNATIFCPLFQDLPSGVEKSFRIMQSTRLKTSRYNLVKFIFSPFVFAVANILLGMFYVEILRETETFAEMGYYIGFGLGYLNSLKSIGVSWRFPFLKSWLRGLLSVVMAMPAILNFGNLFFLIIWLFVVGLEIWYVTKGIDGVTVPD